MKRLTIRYDPASASVLRAVMWMKRQRALVRLEFARGDAPNDLVAVGDGGEVWRGPKAWIMCLWALEAHRGHYPHDARAFIERRSMPPSYAWLHWLIVLTLVGATAFLAMWILSRFP